MRKLLSWLWPTALWLAFLTGSPAALAHAGHAHLPGLSSSVEAAGPASGADCHCPGMLCACSADCLALCAAAIIAADQPGLVFLPGRTILNLAHSQLGPGRLPATDPDPPKPIA